MFGFHAVMKRLIGDRGLHLSCSVGESGKYYVMHYFDGHHDDAELADVEKWFGKDLAPAIVKLESGEGFYCRLVPHVSDMIPLTREEIGYMRDHNSAETVTLEELQKRCEPK